MKKLITLLFSIIALHVQAQYFKFDIPGAEATYVTGINDSANVCGYYTRNGVNKGFFYNGSSIDTFEISLSDHTYPKAINNKNLIIGHRVFQGTQDYGIFIYDANTHSDTLANIPNINGYDPVFAGGITDDTTVVGDYKFMQNSVANRRTWIAKLGYGFNAVDYNILQYGSLPTFAEGINNQKTRVGYVVDGSYNWGWVKTVSGNIDTFKIPTSNKTRFTGISNNNYICGYYNNSIGFYFLLGANNNITQFNKVEIPGATAVFPMGINNKRQLCGYYYDAQGTTHGFIIRGYDIGFRPHLHGWTKSNNFLDMWSYMYTEQPAINYNLDPYLNNGSPFMDDPTGEVPHSRLINEPYAFPDWPMFVNAYSEDSCYINTPAGKITKAKQLGFWYNLLPHHIRNGQFNWVGACSGFTYTSYFTYKDLAFYQSRFPDASLEVSNHFGQTMITPRKKSVNTFQIFQHGEKQRELKYVYPDGFAFKKPIETLALLKKRMLDSTNYCGISIKKYVTVSGNVSGHSMLPYKIVPGDVGFERIYVYDSNYPGDTTRFISVNTEAPNGGSWEYETDSGTWGDEGRGLIMDYEMDLNRENPIVPITTENGYASRAGDNFSDIYFTANAKVTFTNASGQSSIVSPTQLSENFEGGNFFVPATSNPIRPVNFMSYVDNWNAKIQECPDTTSTLAVFENNYFVSCNIHNTQLSHTNKFHYQNEVLTYSNPDNVTKTITFNSAIDAANATYQYSVSSLQVNANDSVGAAVINTNQFKIINYGNTTSYAVSIFYASVGDVTTFNHDAITFGEGSTHIIAPFYDNLNGNGIAIFVDNNSNGVFDDTLFVDNQAPPKLKLGTKFKNIPYGSGVYTVPIANIGGGSLSWQLNNTASWLTINSPMNGIEDGSIQFNADNNSGNYRIGFIIINSNDPNKPIDTLIVAQDGITALENASIVSEISAFPNPTYGLLFIKVPTDNRIKEITLISIDGKQYTVSEFNTEGLSGIHKFDMQHVQSGIYILRVQLSDTTVYDKIIKY